MSEPYLSFVHPDDVAGTLATAAEVFAPGGRVVSFENRYRAKGGGYRWLAWSARADADGQAAYCVARDVTRSKQAGEERFRRAFEDAPTGMALVGAGGRLTRVNGALCGILGYSSTDLVGRTLGELTEADDRAGSALADDRLVAGAVVQYRHEMRMINSRGHPVWVDASASIVRDDQGEQAYRILQIQDITDRRRIEQLQSDFIAVASHELRTPLTSIRGSLGLLAGGALGPLTPQAERMVQLAVRNTDRLGRLINDILDIERVESGTIDMNPAACDAGDLIEQAADGVRALAAAAEVALVVQAEPVRLTADPDRVIETLTNLLGNAVKFSRPAVGFASRAAAWTARSCSRSATKAGASRQKTWSRSSNASPRSTHRTRARRAGPDWAWRSVGASLSSTAAGSGRRASSGTAPCSRSCCPGRRRRGSRRRRPTRGRGFAARWCRGRGSRARRPSSPASGRPNRTGAGHDPGGLRTPPEGGRRPRRRARSPLRGRAARRRRQGGRGNDRRGAGRRHAARGHSVAGHSAGQGLDRRAVGIRGGDRGRRAPRHVDQPAGADPPVRGPERKPGEDGLARARAARRGRRAAPRARAADDRRRARGSRIRRAPPRVGRPG